MTTTNSLPPGTRRTTDEFTAIRVKRGRLWSSAVRLLSGRQLDFEEERKRLIYGSVSVIIIPMLSAFGVYHLTFGPRIEGVANLAVAMYWILSLGLLRGRENGLHLYRVAVLITGVLFVYFGTLGEPDLHRALWSLAYPTFCFLLVGLAEGAVYSLGLFAAWLGFFFLPTSMTGAGDYSNEFIIRFIMVFITLFISSLFAERVRQMYQRAMQAHQGRLEDDKSRLATAEERMRQIALKDDLTGIANRRAILETLEGTLAHERRNGRTVALAVLDLDHFKQINDRYGHLAGDEVLRQSAERIVQTLRSSDFAGRFGGEEFLIVLPDTNASVASKILERVRSALESRPVEFGNESISVTTSIGIADSRQSELRPEALLSQADAALYQAKTRGRNRLEVFSHG